jgi:hypothetical protein
MNDNFTTLTKRLDSLNARFDAMVARDDADSPEVHKIAADLMAKSIKGREKIPEAEARKLYDQMLVAARNVVKAQGARGDAALDGQNPAWKKFKPGQKVRAELMRGSSSQGVVKSLDENGTHVNVEVRKAFGGLSVYKVHHSLVKADSDVYRGDGDRSNEHRFSEELHRANAEREVNFKRSPPKTEAEKKQREQEVQNEMNRLRMRKDAGSNPRAGRASGWDVD